MTRGEDALGGGEMDVFGGGEADVLGARGEGIFEGRGSGLFFFVHFSSSFLKPILVRVPRV